MSSSGWSVKTDTPSYPGDTGGVSTTYTSKDYCNSSGSFCVSGSGSISSSNNSNGVPNQISGGSVGITFKW